MKPNTPFATIEKSGTVTEYQGELQKFDSLSQMQEYVRNKVKTLVFMNPFRTIRERDGDYEAHGDEPILALDVQTSQEMSREELMNTLPDIHIELERLIKPQVTDEEYATIAQEIIKTEIEGWNIAQVIFSQPFSGKIQNYRPEIARAIYKNLLKQRGQYMTFHFSDGENDFLGATPEQHLCIEGDTVTMNPIAGTLKKVDPEDPRPLRERLIDFLNNGKETYELFQVLDEELKMMETLCDDGWHIEWPFLRQNGAVIHTEYRLVGKRKKELNSLDALRQTLHAPTLVGSPEESASQIIKKYEMQSRAYYGGEIGILKPDGTLDTAILIRMAHIRKNGDVTIQAGAGLKRDSIPLKEAQECRAKKDGMERAITGNGREFEDVSELMNDPEILTLLASRNQFLSKFHFEDQSEMPQNFCPELIGKKVTIINFRDDFSLTLARLIRSLWCDVQVIDYTSSHLPRQEDIMILGGGPGDINDDSSEKMRTLQEILKSRGNTPVLGICLWSQAICKHLWLEVRKLARTQQWVQNTIKLFGKDEKVGQYNSYAAFGKIPWCHPKRNQDKSINMIHAQEQKMLGVQFHPESVMTQNGREILKNLLLRLSLQNTPKRKLPLVPTRSLYDYD